MAGREEPFEFTCQYCEAPLPFDDVVKPEVISMLQAREGAGAGDPATKVDVLNSLLEAFEMAGTQTHVDHPLCRKCMDALQADMQERVHVAEAQVKAYQDALALAQEAPQTGHSTAASLGLPGQATPSSLPSAEQQKQQLEAAQREEQGEIERTRRLEAELAQVEAELAEVRAQEAQLDAEEEAFWSRYNALWLDLQQSREDADAIETKTRVTAHHLDHLRQSSALDECFHIWHSGRFGTISGLRLGRWGEEVKWGEVNAAWGQAVLLLDVLSRMYPQFQWQSGVLKPMASRPEISDGKNDFKLYGPVKMSVLSGSSYDKAMLLYLSCLAAFARFAHEKCVREGQPQPFALPNPVDAERGTVRGLSIRYGLGMGAMDIWNRALKYMLVDLKALMHWVISDQALADPAGLVIPPQMQGSDGTEDRGAGAMAASMLISNMAASMMAPRRGAAPRNAGSGTEFADGGARSMFSIMPRRQNSERR